MLLTLVALLACADPADAQMLAPPQGDAPVERAADGRGESAALRVAVLPVTSASLADDERALLTQLLAIRVERGGLEVVDATGCAAPDCLAEVARALKVDAVLLGQHGNLGEADVLTLQLLDVAGARTVRDAASASERGALAEAIGALVDAMIARLVVSLPPLRQPAIRAKYEEARIAVTRDESGWWFVDGAGRAVTENEFVRRYRNETQRHNLDGAEIDREYDVTAWVLTGGAIATGVATVGLTLYFTTTPDGQAFANASDDAWVIVPALGFSAALGMGIYGLIELSEGHMNDGTELDHVLSVAQGEAAARVYNDALLRRITREAAAPH